MRIDDEIRFRGVRRTVGTIDAQPAGVWSLHAARIDCQRGVARQGRECLGCTRLLGWRAGPGRGEVTLDCEWTCFDPVSARMTSGAALVCVAPARECRSAERIAARAGVHRLLVVDGGALVGVVCRHDLARAPDERVARCMSQEVYVIGAAATLGEAAAAMSTLDVGCLPVVRDGRLVGIITRGDLVRSGLPTSRDAASPA